MSEPRWAREGCCVIRLAEPFAAVDCCLDDFSEKGEREQAIIDELVAEANSAAQLREALEAIESHHVNNNRLAGRDEAHSKTLKIAREALAATECEP